MTTTALSFNDFALPWESTRKEDERFKRILKRLLLIFLLLAIVVPWLPLPEIEREIAEKVPPSIAKVILEQKLPAAGPAPPPPEPEPVKQEKAVKPDKTAKKPAPTPKPKSQDAARRKVASMGVAAFSNDLKSLRSSLDIAKLRARNTNVATGAAARSSRSVLGRESASKTSGGIDTSAISKNGSGTQLAGRSGVAISSPIGIGDGTGGGGTGTGSGASGSGGGEHRSSVANGRDMESIRRVFEQHKGAIYALYNRALRRDPEIQGKYVFHIVIEPNGKISTIELISSELENGELERKLLARIRLIDFGPEDVVATPVNYKFDFLPS
jgi:protein TonB